MKKAKKDKEEKTKRRNISIAPEMEEWAEDIIRLRKFKGRSDMIATLIREEWERRHPADVTATGRSESPIALQKGAVKALGEGLKQGKHSKETDPGDVHQE